MGVPGPRDDTAGILRRCQHIDRSAPDRELRLAHMRVRVEHLIWHRAHAYAHEVRHADVQGRTQEQELRLHCEGRATMVELVRMYTKSCRITLKSYRINRE